MTQKQMIISSLCNQAFNIDKYIKIMELLKGEQDIVLDKNFQKLYNGYYGVRRDTDWQKLYYELFQQCRKGEHEISFEAIIQSLHDNLYKSKEIKQVEASFASKMLASLNPDMPIWDRRVLNYFNKHECNLEIIGNEAEEKIESAISNYNKLIQKYQEKEQQAFIADFNELFPSYKDKISDAKKMDCFTWLLG